MQVDDQRNLFLYKNNYYNQKWINLLESDEGYPNGKKLTIHGKDLRQLDQSIFKIDLLLTRLELSPDYQSCLSYRLEHLPSAVGNLVHLRELKLDTNDLKHLPTEISQLVNLERFDLSSNCLKHLPDSFSNLLKLKSLHLTNNLFEKIPNCVFQMTSLCFLDLTSNELEHLDSNFTKLKQTLKHLSVYDNSIRELGTWIDEMQNLEQFWFGKNRIEILPLDITKLKYLDWADCYYSVVLDDNPIQTPPLTICREGFEAIKNWYFQNSITII